ncbi:portal protein [Streptomyces phage Maih]|uniref:Portal protein n=3 Tax=Woodruffvirus TP1604 TaxID=1982746 RepID=A0A0U4JTN4_9CAUD|nr:portal protein [Streptomyces phage Maih]AWN08370.1 portal protein [Streptomyces phage BayC]AWN08441.1 portal protein [Streptomyces phage Salete]USH45385.1 portal protein [Streptomyces phage Asis]
MGVIESITAAATRIITRGKGGGANKNSGQATLAWDFFETVPEVGTYADWVSNAMSGATLFAGKRGPDGTVEAAPEDSRASQLVASIAGGAGGQANLLGDFGTQLAVTGDAWLVIIPDPKSDSYAGDRWVVLSTEEVKAQRGKVRATIDGEDVDIPEYDPEVPQDPDTPVAMRVWKPSPRRRAQATSPVIRSLVILEELRLLNAAVAAIARSRITGRGLLLVPSGARFPTTPGQDKAEDSLLETFIEVSSTAIREPESAAATVPIVLEIPGDLISGVKWLQFTSEFDAMAIQLRDEAIRRFATGADVPAEVLLGLGDASHWGAWALTAEALRMGAEPKLALVCQALTSEWLQPLLDAEKLPDADEWLVWYDTSGLRSSSNKSSSALEAFKEGLISDKAARRELGFTEKDAPGAAEARRVRENNTTEGRTLPVSETEAPPAEPSVTDPELAAAVKTATSLSLLNPTGNATLDTFMAGTDAALAEAVDGLVWAALGVAGRKLLLTPAVPRPARGSARELLATATVHTRHPVARENIAAHRLLDGAWVRVPVIADRYGQDPLALTAALDEYVSALLVTGAAHDFDNVPRLLAQLKVADQWAVTE